ncbi:MAG TPA: hypothetical protein VGR28_00880 [Candidatus Thermoplasmatota archaeon]|jgi:hypothetical protein|nr:hypothetical protein [Candidatus Thermoplasmatota archaeon]
MTTESHEATVARLLRDHAPADAEHALREIKVQLPTQLVMRLHAFKLLGGRSMASTVTAALDAYFRSEPAGARGLEVAVASAGPEPPFDARTGPSP